MIKIKILKEETEASKRHRKHSNKFRSDWDKQYPSNQPGYETPSKRLKRIFGDEYVAMLSLGRGILEEDFLLDVLDDLEEKKEACVAGNQNHNKSTGKFSSGSDEGSWSIAADEKYKGKERRTGCDRGQMGRKGKVRTFQKIPCGRRGRRSIGGKPPTYYRCSDGKRVVPEGAVQVPEKDGKVDLYAVAKKLRAKQDKIERLAGIITKLSKRKDCKDLTAKQLVVWVDAFARAEKAKLAPSKT